MNPSRVTARGLAVMGLSSGRLPGVELVFNKRSRNHRAEGHANLALALNGDPSGQTSFVEGVLYAFACASEIRRMDRFESTPVNYSRDVVTVETARGRVPAWTYFANPAVQATGLLPSRDYMAHLLAGAPYLSQPYLEWLRCHPCRGET